MKKYFVLLPVLLACAGLVYAQSQTGQIFGQVTDPTGSSVSGAKVTLSSPAMLQPIEVATSDAGTYQFPNIPIGTYAVKFELAGYRTVLHENIRIEIGFNAEINAQLKISSVEQTVEVSGSAPVVDVQSTTQDSHLDQERLQEVPSGRGQFNLVEVAPGVAGGSKDVGGATNGQQTRFVSRGADPEQARYYMDGVDLAPAGGGNGYWMDYDSIAEMEITQGGADASVMSAGMVVNMVSKSGSDSLHGSAHLFEEGQTFESNNMSQAMRVATSFPGSSPGNPLQHFADYGAEVGGPIKKGRLWFWGDYAQQTVTVGDDKTYKTIPECAPVAANELAYPWSTVRSCTHSDAITLKHIAYKIGWQPFHNNTFTFENRYDVKQQSAFRYSPQNPLLSSQVLTSAYDSSVSIGPRFWDAGWPALWRFDDQQIISDRWILDVSFSHFFKFTEMNTQTAALRNVQIQFEQSSSQFNKSYFYSQQTQPYNDVKVASNYFLPGKLGGNNTIKVGYDYVRYESNTSQQAGGAAEAIFNSGTAPAFTTPLAVNFYRLLSADTFLYHQSAYIVDTYTHKRLTLNLGVRWDRQTDSERPQSVPASIYEGQTTFTGTPFNFLPAVQYPGANDGVVWNNWGPRIGATYDITGRGKTVVKASYARYHDLRSAGELADTYDTVGTVSPSSVQSFVQFPWTDLNHDGIVQMNEVNTTTVRSFGGQYNPANPTQTVSPNSVDPHIKAPQADEILAGVSQEIAPGFGVSVTYIYRKYTNFVWQQRNGISSSNYSPVTFAPPASSCPTTVAPTAPTQCSTVTYYVPNIAVPAAYTLTNQPDYYRTYHGIEVLLRKVMSKSWMLYGSFTYQGTRQYWSASDAYQDPTNIAQQNGAEFAPVESTGTGTISIPTDARWISRFGGQYRLPRYGIAV